MDRLASDAPFVRARELALCDMQTEAIAEWRAGYVALERAAQIQAIGLAARWTWYLQAISAPARLRVFDDYDLLYPHPYDPEVRRGSSLSGLPPDLIYAIIQQESLYRADAGSSAGALGLMQLLQPAVNIPLGSSYLAYLVHRFDGETALAAAAYNAGPNAARRWLPALTD